ncbi:MAG: glycoside hydrolase family 97 protein [Bacteroidota bacterium]
MRLLAGLAVLLMAPLALAQTVTVSSPSGVLDAHVTLGARGDLSYRVTRFGHEVIAPSRLGFDLVDAAPLAEGFEIVGVDTAAVDETWEQPWGEERFVRDYHHELRVSAQEASGERRRMDVVVRVFDEGVALRYEIPEQPNLTTFAIADELTEIAVASDPMAWWIGAYQGNRYEFVYEHTRLSQADTVHTPVTLETDAGLVISLHEAALVDYSSMTLAPRVTGTGVTLEADLIPWSTGVKVYTAAPMRTPWRMIQITDSAADLAQSLMLLNLNEPNALGDVSWVQPEAYVGIWWAMHLDMWTWGQGERHGATTEHTREYIDFAAENGFGGVLVEGWNVGWDGNWFDGGTDFSFTEPYPDFDLEGLAAYARARGVHLIGHHETGAGVEGYEAQMDDAFALYNRLGIPTVKTGYVGHGQTIKRTTGPGTSGESPAREWHHGQFMVRHYQASVEAAARHEVSLNIHEPIKDTGLRRTYPNLLTREGARGQEYNAWSQDGGNPPEHTAILPFTRMLAAPMDFTPGIVDLLLPGKPDNRVNTTLAKQLALYVVLYSPVQMAADLPENYAEHPEPLAFIQSVAVDWERTVWLDSRIGDYAVVARQRRGGEDWFLGALTDETGRLLRAPLSFLEPGQAYVADVWRDADDADWKTNPSALTREAALVRRGDVLPLRLAPGGGQAVWLRPATAEEIERLEE